VRDKQTRKEMYRKGEERGMGEEGGGEDFFGKKISYHKNLKGRLRSHKVIAVGWGGEG